MVGVWWGGRYNKKCVGYPLVPELKCIKFTLKLTLRFVELDVISSGFTTKINRTM